MELRLAIVDDDISIRKMLRRIIEDTGLGIVVTECSDGILAEEVLRVSLPDIALIDMLLPGQDGVELITRLSTERLNISYIMISQVNSEPMITRAYESGIEFFIHKPINVLEVRSVINKIKESRKLRQFMSYVHQTTSQFTGQNPSAKVDGENKHKSAIYRTFSDLGIIGEAGVKDIYALIELICANQRQDNESTYQLNELYGQLSQKLNQDAKAIEQRIRRTITKAMQNLVNLGVEDYYNEKFQNYSSSLFDFKEVRQEISFVNGKSNYHGKINVKKFIQGIIFIAGQAG
ncbi:histidine kinase [Anaerosporomusa subterranea]|uniref:Histidine kinase n=1 Tax=Anaerosporomusa subterranea TaxID=1794912 RepID=A0A154BMJ2_ANASB|nr:response regulator [Anaerosporomusa subterranea]KYZ74728.1 histidine kinase [Anaerosporomusa subterranea]